MAHPNDLPQSVITESTESPLTSVIGLDDKYQCVTGHAYMTGTQALLRVLLTQRLRDEQHGYASAAFVSGYRGSPVGGLDLTLYKASALLKQHKIEFNPGVNEELAATSIWGTQQIALWGDANVAGVLGMWYGKGPGVDRCPDVWRHANGAGTAPLGGVLAIAGDDHAAKSSTYPNHSDGIFASVGMPLLYPASVQDIVDFGIHGYAMSRYCGAWVGMKAVTDIIESAAIVDVDIHRVHTVIPTGHVLPPKGVHIRWPDTPNDIGARVWQDKLPAALAYARVNQLNKQVFGQGDRLGIVTAGKSLGDTLTALELLGLDQANCSHLGVSVFQCGMIWPLEPQTLIEYASSKQSILVVEELRPTLEVQVKDILYGHNKRPSVYGKDVLPVVGELSPLLIAQAILQVLENNKQSLPTDGWCGLAVLHAQLNVLQVSKQTNIAHTQEQRQPWFCSGCPHSTSTRVPEGSRALAGIGCHYMAQWMDRDTATFTQMGGEGTPWIGASPFVQTDHVFANLGDGTYFHSGVLAVRAAIAAKVNITYKILYNDAVAMTGGQPHDGGVTAHSIAAQMLAEGAVHVCVVSYQPQRFEQNPLPVGVALYPRAELDDVQRSLRQMPGCTVLIYDQPCATEKRRKLKVKPLPVAQRQYAYIHPEVCEGCGDCSTQSNCLSVEPLDTVLGRKRRINQSSCNTDMSCVKGFCPSFVTVSGVTLKKPKAAQQLTESQRVPEISIPLPNVQSLTQAVGVLVVGIGGTGVVTIGQLLGMAAHLEGKGCSVLDMSGLAQKGGPVHSHVRIFTSPIAIPQAIKLAPQQAQVLLACDGVVAIDPQVTSRLSSTAHVLLNQAQSPTAAWLKDRQWNYPAQQCSQVLQAAIGAQQLCQFDAQVAAVALLGDAIYTNPMMLGFAWQSGWLPIGYEAMRQAMVLNGTQVANNLTAFEWGRLAAYDQAALQQAIQRNQPTQPILFQAQETLDEIIADRQRRLTQYQNPAYAAQYLSYVQAVQAAETKLGKEVLTKTVAKRLYHLMAIKDEYEVARLYSADSFKQAIQKQFEGTPTLSFHLSPPLMARYDTQGKAIKQMYQGIWMKPLFKVLTACKGLRGTALDIFGYTAERRMERTLLQDYLQLIQIILPNLTAANLTEAVNIANAVEHVRGYGHVKAQAVERYYVQLNSMLKTSTFHR